MQNRNLIIRLVTIVLLAGGLVFFELFGQTSSVDSAGLLSVTFLDVGQGDSILIQTPDGVQLLIDGGPDSSVLQQLSQSMPLFDNTIDVILGTHPDKDHIGGLVDVLARYEVDHIITTENTGETMVSASYQKALINEGVPVTFARAGMIFELGASTTLTIFSPASSPAMLESNTASIVAQLKYGDIEFMFTGDAPIAIENYLVGTYGNVLNSEVLKLGHHGSKTASGEAFLDTVKPVYAVVSAGKGNSYGHPHAVVTEAVLDRGINLVSTIDGGAVTFMSDGHELWLK